MEYDIIIIGAGAAGLSAGLYAARAGMKVKVLEKASAGGQMLLTDLVENFPGFPEGIKGPALAGRLKAQAEKSGLKIIGEEVKEIVFARSCDAVSGYTVKTEGRTYRAHSIILACGAIPKRLGVPREETLTGRGVSYCATCDGPLFRNRRIIVVGAGNAACEEALYLSKFVRSVTLIHRRGRLRADKVLRDRLKAEPKIDFIWNSKVLEIAGEEKVSGVKIEDINTGKKRDVPCEGVFIFAGLKPNTDFLKGAVNTDPQGFIVTGQNLETSRKGIFACGDCRLRPLRQIVTACSEGAEAAVASRNYVEELKGTAYA
ncbi:MAG: thioredoxin-disulfide reductase [Candidatus Omnitrophica bacterium]|nr:thioredoxin-disulfide reductase [Candidatus Omnitrophota bacterium]MBU3933564.1 thioredoxin-disulfide reductase [Candidatus Omnitrophota bacterium]